MWTASALVMMCLLLWLCELMIVSAAPTPIWNLDQVGSYFNGIFRSVVGPLFGEGDDARNETAV